MKSLVLCTVLALALASCSKTPEPSPAPAPEKPAEKASDKSGDKPGDKAGTTSPNAATTQGAAPAAAAGDLAWDAPSGWTSAPNGSVMRKATYKIPKAHGDTEDADFSVMTAGGGVDSNIKRWAGQFGNAQPTTSPRTVNGLKVMVVEIKGTYAGGGMMGGAAASREHQMLLGAIVDRGETQEFFKMVGPEKTVTAAKPDFDKLVSSLHVK